jgi:hypothetical protein
LSPFAKIVSALEQRFGGTLRQYLAAADGAGVVVCALAKSAKA